MICPSAAPPSIPSASFHLTLTCPRPKNGIHIFLDVVSGPSAAAPRIALSENQKREFRKTAKIVAERPWEMNRGAKFLEDLVSNNEQGGLPSWEYPDVNWVFGEAPDRGDGYEAPSALRPGAT